jgi:hypothetical protein
LMFSSFPFVLTCVLASMTMLIEVDSEISLPIGTLKNNLNRLKLYEQYPSTTKSAMPDFSRPWQGGE